MVIMEQRAGYFGLMALLACLIATTTAAASIDMTFCASLNTASSGANSSIYQSDGLCHDFCLSSFAFAIVQDNSCWCSDYAPDSSIQVDTSKCSQACPGYSEDTCGGSGLWGYMALNKAAVGTKGAPSTSTTSTKAPAATTTQAQAQVTTETVQNTVQNTVTYIPPPASTTSTSRTPQSSSTSSSSSSSSSTTTPTTSTADATPEVTTAPPVVSVATVTAGGEVSLKTVTVIPTVTANSSGSSAQIDSTPSNSLTTGAAVGIAVGVLGAFVAFAAVFVIFCLKKRRQRQEQEMLQRNNSGRGSSSGMMGTPRTEMTGTSVWEGGEYLPRRNSRLMPHDPRMDPFAGNIYGTRFENRSHETVNTLEDNQDYSRKVLRTTNPDPEDN